MYSQSGAWERVKGYTIYDLGTGPKSNKKGLFYGMEAREVFGDQ